MTRKVLIDFLAFLIRQFRVICQMCGNIARQTIDEIRYNKVHSAACQALTRLVWLYLPFLFY